MLYGTVDYTLKDGKGTTVDWAARAHFVGEGDDLKMDFYQVYLVSLNQAMGDLPTTVFTDMVIGLCSDGTCKIGECVFHFGSSICVQASDLRNFPFMVDCL
jgi:hypothetical protein